MSELRRLQKIIKLISEELGKDKARTIRGLGAGHSYTTKSDKKHLGDDDPFGVKKKRPKTKKKKPVTISKAFISGEEREDSGVQEVELTLNEAVAQDNNSMKEKLREKWKEVNKRDD